MIKKSKYLFIFCILIIIIFLYFSFYFFTKIDFKDVNKKDIERDTAENPTIGSRNTQITIVAFVDFRCPFCKKFENNVLSKVKNRYVREQKVKIRVVNPAILGKNSELGAKAANAVYLYSPEKYWEFVDALYKEQPKNENNWITYKLIDKKLSETNISEAKMQLIKKDYKSQGGYSEKMLRRDKKLYKKYRNEYVPSVYINGRFVRNPYSFNDVKKEISSINR